MKKYGQVKVIGTETLKMHLFFGNSRADLDSVGACDVLDAFESLVALAEDIQLVNLDIRSGVLLNAELHGKDQP